MARPSDDYDDHSDLDWFREELRQRDRMIGELRDERDEQADLIGRFVEYEDDYRATLESYRETFGMELTEGGWTWMPFWDERNELIDQYNDLVKRWNRAVPDLNAGMKDVGRPLDASEAQIVDVIRLRRQRYSLRDIVMETNLGLQTVRTIIGRHHGTDRTTKARKQKVARIEFDKHQRAHWKSQKRTGDALPKRVQAVIETGEALVKEAKGLGRR